MNCSVAAPGVVVACCKLGKDTGMGISAFRLRLWAWAVVVVCVASFAYSRSLSLPLMSDDYGVILLSRVYGPLSGWSQLFSDALYRCRATNIVITYWLDQWFGLWPLAYSVTSLLLHSANCLLVLAFGFWPVIGWRIAVTAALCFAVFHEPQEAVIWYSASPELLVFLFSCSSLLCYIGWLRTGRRLLLIPCLLLFGMALLSKESAVVTPALMALATLVERRKDRFAWG